MLTEIYLNGKAVSEAVEKILINAVTVEKPEIKSNFSELARGGRIKNSIWRSFMKITLEAQFRAVGKPILRAECVDKLNAWAAGGGYLTLSNRPGKRVYVECTQTASEGTLHKSAEVATVEFQTTYSPYWENIEPTVAEAVTSPFDPEAEETLHMACTEASLVSVSVEIHDIPATTLTVSVGDTSIKLQGAENVLENGTTEILPFAEVGETVHFTNESGVFTITKNGESLISLRTVDSSDELIAQPGDNRVSASSNANVKCIFSSHGRWN